MTTAVPLGLIVAVVLAVQSLPAQDRFATQREYMVKHYLEAEGINNPRVLQAMRSIPRHEFVNSRDRDQAYQDAALPIGYKQTISPPFIVAYMTQTIDPQPTDNILEIGTGSGYQAAVLSPLAKSVYSIEIVEGLGRLAGRRLKELGYDNVTTKVGDGYKGWPEHAPFDKIIVTCSPESVPQPLVDQLKNGGKMLIPLGERYQQVFYLFEKKDGRLIQQKLVPTLFVPMTGISEDKRQVLPDPANPKLVNPSFEIDENGDSLADHWHYQRQTKLISSEARDGNQYLQFTNTEPGRVAGILQGTALDGEKIDALQFTIWAKCAGANTGTENWEKPAMMIHFYDSIRRPIGNITIAAWTGTKDWEQYAQTIKVPREAREAIIRVGLNGGTGELCVDALTMRVVPR